VAAHASAVTHLVPSHEDIALQLGLLVPQINGLPYFFFLLGKGYGWLFDRNLRLVGLFGGTCLGGVGFVGIIAGPFIFFFCLGFEEIKGFIHSVLVTINDQIII
jgi:hypothetical protein